MSMRAGDRRQRDLKPVSRHIVVAAISHYNWPAAWAPIAIQNSVARAERLRAASHHMLDGELGFVRSRVRRSKIILPLRV
jgi:hypothetical protein